MQKQQIAVNRVWRLQKEASDFKADMMRLMSHMGSHGASEQQKSADLSVQQEPADWSVQQKADVRTVVASTSLQPPVLLRAQEQEKKNCQRHHNRQQWTNRTKTSSKRLEISL